MWNYRTIQTEVKDDEEELDKLGIIWDASDPNSSGFWEKILDGVAGVLLLPVKFILILLGLVLSLFLRVFQLDGEPLVSVSTIIFNKTKIVSIDFFDLNTGNDILNQIHMNVAAWFVSLRNIAIVSLALVLIYVGIKMAISTIAEDKAKYKRMLFDWTLSICLVIMMNIIIVLIIEVNNTVVGILSKVADDSGDISGFAAMLRDNSVKSITFTEGVGDAIAYLMFIMLSFAFLLSYLKRMITIGFLIIIAPISAVTYSLDKMGDGKSQVLNTWFKEFIYNILIQPFHCVTYLALVSIISSFNDDATLSSAVLTILLLFFLTKGAEDLVTKIFNFQSKSRPTVAQSAAVGAALAGSAMAIAKNVTKVKGDYKDFKAKEGIPGKDKAKPKTKDSKDKDKKGKDKKKDGKDKKDKTKDKKEKKEIRTDKWKQNINRAVRNAAIDANFAVLGGGIGMAVGGATGDESNLANSTIAGAGFGASIGNSHKNKLKAGDTKRDTARAFNDYKAKTGMTDEQVKKRGNNLLSGKIDPQNKDDEEYLKQLKKSQAMFKGQGLDKEKSLGAVGDLLQDIQDGVVSETSVPEKFMGNLKEQIKDKFNAD